MSRFNYADYQKVIEKAQAGGSNLAKVGFFKLKDNGDQALVRLNVSSVEDLQFASVHTISSNGKWLRVSCLNTIGSFESKCPLCNANTNGNSSISKAAKRVYLQMLASYRDPATGVFSAPTPVVWERPAGFSTEIINLLQQYGQAGINLKNVLLLITRNGKAGDMKTTYSLMAAPEAIYKQEMIPADFSAFENFNIAKHSYWEKTIEEINTFLATGSFPEVNTATNTAAQTSAYNSQTVATNAAVHAQPTAPQATVINSQVTAPQFQQNTAPVYPSAQQANPVNQSDAQEAQPTAPRSIGNFNGFSF